MWQSVISDSPPEEMKLNSSEGSGSNSLTGGLGNRDRDMQSIVTDTNMAFEVPQARQSI